MIFCIFGRSEVAIFCIFAVLNLLMFEISCLKMQKKVLPKLQRTETKIQKKKFKGQKVENLFRKKKTAKIEKPQNQKSQN